jgi:hypothetical protein
MVRARERMQCAGFDSVPLYAKVQAAEDALHALWVALHYRSCPSGTGQSRSERG